MRMPTMTHDAAEALIRGVAPAASPELAPLAAAIADFRGAAFATPPRPSAELMARLQLAGASEISVAGVPTRNAAATASQVTTTSRSRSLGGVRRALGWFAGLGIVAKILVGASVAAAAGATGVGAVAGVTEIVSTVTSTTEVPAPAEPDAPVTESGGEAVVPEEAPVGDAPATVATEEPTEAVETESPAPAESEPADPNPGHGNNGNPGDNGNSGNNGNPGSNGNSGHGNPGNGNNGNSGSNGNSGNNGNGNSKNK